MSLDYEGWLIEADGECIGVVLGEIAWVPYVYEDALIFAREKDAANFLGVLRKTQITHVPESAFVADHGWYTDEDVDDTN